MQSQRIGNAESFSTHLAGVGLLTSMHPFVLDFLIGTGKHSFTELARKAPFLVVATIGACRGFFHSIDGSGLLVNLEVHLVGDRVLKLSVTDFATDFLVHLLVHLLVH